MAFPDRADLSPKPSVSHKMVVKIMSGVVLPEVATCSRYEFASVLDAASERCQHGQGCSHSSL